MPIVPEDLENLHGLGRGAEVIRYSVLRLEYWISPRGSLRECLRWNLTAGAAMGIPAVIIVPVVTYLLGQFVTWSALLVEIMKNLLIFPALALAFLVLLTGIVLFIRILVK